MNILWVIAGGLWPLNTGGRQRSFNIVSQLSRRHAVTLLTTHSQGDDPDGLRANLKDCKQVTSFACSIPKAGSPRFAAALLRSWLSPYPVDILKSRVPALRKEVQRHMAAGKIDVCIADFLGTTSNVPMTQRVPTVLFQHNVEYVIWKRLKEVDQKVWRRTLLEVEWRKMRRYEAQVCQQSDLVITVSDADRDTIVAEAPNAGVRSIPTGVDSNYFAPNGWHENPLELVFTGSMDWYPNEDGMLYFIESILPQIRREIPNVSLTIVGRNPTDRIRSAATVAGVKVTGTVDDVRPHIAGAAVYIVPLRVGGGTRMKIFEALAMGKAVVSTTIGAEGLPLTHGKDFLRADTPEEFASAVLCLLKDSVKRRALGSEGRDLVEKRHSWSQVAMEFEKRCGEAISQSRNN